MGIVLASAAAAGVLLAGSNQERVSEAVSARGQESRPAAQPPGRVIATINTEATLKQFYPKAADMFDAPELDVVVRGTVAAVHFWASGGFAYTDLKIDVASSRGLRVPPMITVHEDGGYLPASDMIAEMKSKFPSVRPTIDPAAYVDARFEGADHLGVGAEVLLFLTRDPNVGRGQDFLELSSVYGRFTRSLDGDFVRPGGDPSIETTITAEQLSARNLE